MDNNHTNNNASLSSVFDRHDSNVAPPRHLRQLFISVLVLLSITSLLSSYDFVYPSDSDSATTSVKSTTQEQMVNENDELLPFEDERSQSSSSPTEQNYDNQITPPPTSSSPPPLNLSIPLKVPLTTVTPATIPPHALGGATLPMFLGTWHPSPTPSPIICPTNAASPIKFKCNYTTSVRRRTSKKYIPPTPLPPFDALRFESLVHERGPLLFVGDSIGGQLVTALLCLLEETIGWERANSTSVYLYRYAALVEPPLEVRNDVEMIPGSGIEDKRYFFDTSWVEDAIAANASFVIYNTGAWWNNKLYFRQRGEWCDWSSWPAISREETVRLFESSFRYRVIPALKRLWRDYGIRTVWFDAPVGGEWDDSIQDIKGGVYTDYYHMFPVFNSIGRRLVVEEAEGWLLPTFDLSLKRWDDHVFDDANYTDYDALHWCETYDRNYVPAVWAHLLEQVLFGRGGDAIDEGYDDAIMDNTEYDILEVQDVPTVDESDSIETSPDRESRRLAMYENHDDIITLPFPNNVLTMMMTSKKIRRRDLRQFQRIPFSRSNETTCPCSDGTTSYHCVANIDCEWVMSSEAMHVCRDKS